MATSGRRLLNIASAATQVAASSTSNPFASRNSRRPKRTPGSSSTTSTRFLATRGLRRLRRGIEGQTDRDHRAALGAIAGMDHAAVFLHDALGDGEAEAGSSRPPRVERAEDVRQVLAAEPGPGIVHRALDPAPAVDHSRA